MFSYLNGIIADKSYNSIVIDVGGVGFFCTTTAFSLNQFGQIGEKSKAFTYMSVKEDAIDLFAFSSSEELECFKKLITVNGVGPKAAISILSAISTSELVNAVNTGNYTAITKAQGVGPKLAQRVVLELKDKLSDFGVAAANDNFNPFIGSNSNSDEAISALISLGYSANEAKRAVASLNTAEMTVEDIIKIALKSMI